MTLLVILFNRLALFSSHLFQFLQPLLLEGSERVSQSLCNRQIAKPFIVGRDYKPGRVFSAATIECALVSCCVIIPMLALLPVANRELPRLDRLFLAFEESPLLLVFADV